MKKLLLIVLLLVTLVVTAVACTNEDKPAADTTAAETTGNADPGETTVGGEEETTVGGEEDETTAGSEETTAGSEETTEGDTTEEVTTEAETRDPYKAVDVIVAQQLADKHGASNLDVALDETGLFAVITPAAADGYYIPMYATVLPETADAQVIMPALEGGRYIVIKYRTSTAMDMSTRVYIGSEGDAPADDTKGYVEAALTADGEWHLAILDTQALIDAGIYNGTTYSYLRFDALEGTLPAGASLDVEYIAFFESTEPVEAYDAYLENKPAPLYYTSAWELSERATAGGTTCYGWHVMSRFGNTKYMHGEAGIQDPVFSTYADAITGGQYIVVKYRTDVPDAMMQIYIGSSGTGPSTDEQMVELPLIADMQWHTLVFDTQSVIDLGHYDGSSVAWMRLDALDPGPLLDENGNTIPSLDANGNEIALPSTLPPHAHIDYEYIAFFDDIDEANAYAADFTFTPSEGGEDEGETTVGGETPVGEPPVFVSNAQDMVFDGGVNRCQGIVSAIVSEDGTYNIITINNGDPYAWNFRPGQAVGGRYIGFKYRVTTEKAVNVEFFVSGGDIGADNQLKYALTADGEWHVGIIDTKPLIDAGLYDGETLGTFRFDPLAPATGSTLEDIGTDVIDYAWVGMFNAEADIEAYAAAN